MKIPKLHLKLTPKLLLIIVSGILFVVAIQTTISISNDIQRNDEATRKTLQGLQTDYTNRIEILEGQAASLAATFADRADIRELFIAGDREGLLELLMPIFTTLNTQYRFAHLYVEDSQGVVFLRVHNPSQFGDDVTYRGTIADAIQEQRTVAGPEIGPSRLGIRGVSPMFSGDEIVGLIEVGLDYDQAFIDNLKQTNQADYKLWVTYAAAAAANLQPAEDAPPAPIEELFYYADTGHAVSDIPAQAYRQVLQNGQSETFFTQSAIGAEAVILAPLTIYGERVIGVIEITISREEARVALQLSEALTVAVAFVLVLFVSIMVGAASNRIVIAPLNDLAEVARQWVRGGISARAAIHTGDEYEEVATVFNQMAAQLEESLQALESRVAERTQALEKRTRYLEAAARVSQSASSSLNIDQILREAVNLIRDQFGLYYTGLFLVDSAGEWAVLRAATGEAGQAMLGRGHRIRVGEGMIGWSVANAQNRVAQEAGQDPVRLSTPELPLTRSEAAIPLRAHGAVLGALTLQSTDPMAFDETMLTALQTMADQLGIALDNARLYIEAQTVIESSRQLAGEVSRQAWLQTLERWNNLGYRSTPERPISPVEDAWGQAIEQARLTGEPVVEPESLVLALPITIRDTAIGAVKLRKTAGNWTNEEIRLMRTLTEQLSIALDSARLYSETQRRAQREHVLADITARVRASTNVQIILQTAVQELADALNVSKASIVLKGSNGDQAHEQ